MSKDKKELLYAAALSLIHEKGDLASIKVADIAMRANMGKSTVYEYFDSKEQLIAESLVNMFKKGIVTFKQLITKDLTFKETYFILLDRIAVLMNSNRTLLEYITMNECNLTVQTTIKEIMIERVEEIKAEYMDMVEKLVDKSVEEGLVKDKPSKFDWYMAVTHSITCIFVHKQEFKEFKSLTDDEVKEKAYKTYLKLLN